MRTMEEVKAELKNVLDGITCLNMADRLTPAEKEERRALDRRLYELQDEMEDIARAQEVTHENRLN